MAESPRCPNPNCTKPMTFVGESDNGDSYLFGCPCGGSRVVTKPQVRDAAQHAAKLQRQAASVDRTPKRSYSFSKGSR